MNLQKEHRNKQHKVTKPQTNNQLKICDLCGKEVTSMTTHYRYSNGKLVTEILIPLHFTYIEGLYCLLLNDSNFELRI